MSPLIISSGSPVGLFFLDFDSTSGRLGIAKPSPIVAGATFVVSNASGTRLYATLEENSHLAAIAVDRASGSLTLLNSQPVGAAGPCHLALDHTAQTLVVASYSGGAISAFPVQPDGSLGERSALFFHEGTGPDLPRQDRAHAHSVTISPDQRVCYACDLTLDEVVVYRLGSSPGELLSPTVPPGRVPPGHGPRHAKITRDGRFLYVLNELRGSITTFAIATVDGSLTALDTIPTLPPDHHGFNNSSEIRLHPLNEAWVYAANRGPNSLAHFERDPETGRLTSRAIVPSGGDHPRNFALSPDGRWLVCANRYANEVVTFAIDAENGSLSATPHHTSVPDPCCVMFRS